MRRLLIGLAALAVSGCAVTETPDQRQSLTMGGQVQAVTAAPAPLHLVPVRPTRLRLGWIDAKVVPLRLEGAALTPPPDPNVVGWWGRRVGARRGTTLLTGHTVHTGGGKLDDLEDVAVGTVATVSGVRYTVVSNRVISKAALAREAGRLFNQSGPARLVVVTCEDYDPTTGHYGSNVVVVAKPTVSH